MLIITVIFSATSSTFAVTAKAPAAIAQNINQTIAVTRAEKLGAMDKQNSSTAEINKIMRRDEFAKAIVIAAGLQDSANSLRYQSIFSDVTTTNKMVGYVNTAVNKGFLTGMADGKFHPEQNVTFAQACSAVVKVLGYTDNDVTGVWPNNYIEKARNLKLLDGINLKNNDGLSRGIAAVIIDRLLNTNIKKNNSQDPDKTLISSEGFFTDSIILENSQISSKLADNQVLTDQGVFYLTDNSIKLVVGDKYRLHITDNTIDKIYYDLKTIKSIEVTNVNNNIITYNENNKAINMTLSDKLVYYYNGVKQSYDNLKNILQGESTIVFANNDDNIGYEYAVIIDPIYSIPVIANNIKAGDKSIGNIDLSDGELIIKNGGYINLTDIQNGDVVYQVSDITNANKYIFVMDSKIQGKLTGILPNRLYPNTIQIDNKNYSISKDMDLSKLTNKDSVYNIGDTVQISYGYDNTIVDISKNAVVGSNVDCIILGNSTTNNNLADNQVLTDQGIFYLSDSKINFTVGSKYTLYINNDEIISSSKAINQVKSIVVSSVKSTGITYTDNGKQIQMTLPDKVIYYYQGAKQMYNNLQNILQVDSTIILGYNSDNIGYEYAAIIDPVYSKPVIANNIKVGDKKIGNIDLTNWGLVEKDGEYINPYNIANGDVVYQINDIQNTSSYILAMDNKVTGVITGILPNRINPQTIQIDNKNYELSSDFDMQKLIDKNSPFKIGDTVQISTGYDGKIVNLDYVSGQDNANLAYVINTSTDVIGGNPIYYVKLIKADGTVGTYKSYLDETALKGSLVTFTNTDDTTVVVNAILNQSYPEMAINKDDMKIGNNYATDNIRIFDVISNYPGADAVVKVLNWSDLYSGILQAGQISYLNQVGDFGDINAMVLNDVFDEGDSYGLVKSATATVASSGRSRTTTYNYTINVNGKDYQWTTTNAYGISGMDIVSVGISNGQIASFAGIVNNETEATNIQAIDTKKIKLNNNIYKFRSDVVVYYRSSAGVFTTEAISDIDITKTYSSVYVYLDKPLSYGGKVKAIIISE